MFELGSIKEVAERLSIPQHKCRALAYKNREHLLAMTNTELAVMGAKAVRTVKEALDEDGSVPKGDVRLKAAETVLDRIGAAKKQVVENEVKTSSPILLMPSKDPVIKPTIKISNIDDEE